ncbi:predicted protein [Plenodomus lingam JN3]|uniref:Predicted protein n=1 Tax=Leptosphaeria maculans (strain JN3 / isolate v23.1.3 / race Av1-4-5-6-7-8) TaxID=985895 RepID=E5AF26_LEPMJ|nr:predicted protein [Plenodomus lingam JN3]CBY01815.1 predicted protein [Plenodomus lingam JN3]
MGLLSLSLSLSVCVCLCLPFSPPNLFSPQKQTDSSGSTVNAPQGRRGARRRSPVMEQAIVSPGTDGVDDVAISHAVQAASLWTTGRFGDGHYRVSYQTHKSPCLSPALRKPSHGLGERVHSTRCPHAASPSHSAHQPHNESRLFSALRCTLPRVSTLKLCSSRLAALFRNLLLRAPPSSAPGLKWRHQQIFALIFKALEIATTQVRPILRGHMSICTYGLLVKDAAMSHRPGWRWVSPVRGVASLHSLVPRPSVHTVETWYAQMASGGRESKACRL